MSIISYYPTIVSVIVYLFYIWSTSLNHRHRILIKPRVRSVIFENCILDKFKFSLTDDNQFGFKEGLGCSHAIYKYIHIQITCVRRYKNGPAFWKV